MKKIFTLAITAATVIACGEKAKTTQQIVDANNLKEIKTKRAEILGELKLLDAAVAKLDTVKKLALVSTLPIKSQDFMHYVEFQGNVETKQNLVLYPEFNGTLERVYVKEGQKVSKGQTIATIDDSGLKEQLEQAQTGTELAKTTYERQARLWKQKIGSEIQYLQAKTNYESSVKTVEQIKAQLANTKVIAPFSGVIDDVITDQGAFVAAGQSPIVRLVNLNNMTITAHVPEAHIKTVTKGKGVKLNFPVLGETAETTVKSTGSFINPQSRNFKVEMNVPNNIAAKPNMTVKLNINDYHNPEAILIPQSVISENEHNQEYIFIATGKGKNKVAKKTFIKTGKTQGDYIEVLEGLANNTEIISEGARKVKDGQEVNVIN